MFYVFGWVFFIISNHLSSLSFEVKQKKKLTWAFKVLQIKHILSQEYDGGDGEAVTQTQVHS